MKPGTTNLDKAIYYRLIALWVLCEAMLGGIIHGLQIPVSGLIVGSSAVICIALIANYYPTGGAIMKATIVVAVFKMMLSPQSPPPAYIAVFFQGLTGELFFWNKKFYRISCLFFATLALLESGLQRIVVLTILYGNNFWKAINNFINNLTGQKEITNYSLYIAGGYVLLHIVAGLLVGWCCGILPKRIIKWRQSRAENLFVANNVSEPLQTKTKKKKRIRTSLLIIWIVLILLYLQSYFRIGTPILPSQVALEIILRSAIIVLTWYFLIGPILSYYLKKWLQKKKTKSQQDIQQVLQLLPTMQQLLSKSWQLSSQQKGIKRIIHFGKIVLVNALYQPISDKKIYVVTGAIQSGKTTKLLRWSERRKDVFGILTPVTDGKRFFLDIERKENFRMEAEPGEEALLIGKFSFSKKNFESAGKVLEKAMTNASGWLVVDEIGPLELRGEGFYEAVKKIVRAETNLKILFVIRESILEKALDFFQIKKEAVIMIDSHSEIPYE